MRLTTAKEFVLEYGIREVGQLLTNKGTINASTTDDTVSAYTTAMFESGDSDNDLSAAIETELNRYIDRAQSDVEPHLKKYYKWPLQSDGFELKQSDTPALVVDIIQEIARYYLDDENTRHVEEISTVYQRYKKAHKKAVMIGNGELKLTGLDLKYEDKIVYSL